MRKLNLFYPRAGLWKLMLWTFVLSLFAFQPTYGQSLLYATDFENGLDSSTIQGNGALIDAGDSHGTVFHNAAGGQAIRTNYLILPDNIFADLETAATNELTVSFWVNKGTAVDYYWTPLFTAYGAAPNPDNTSPMFTLQSRGWTQVNDGAGNWCDYSAEQKNFGTESTGWIDDGNWHHYAASITSTGTIIYIDGVPTHSWTIDGTTAAGGVNGLLSTGSLYTYITLGGNQSWNWGDPDPAFYFDNLKIYDGALSAGQVTALRDFDDINASVLAVSATEMFLDDVYSSATFTVDGLNLDNDVTITAPTGLTVSPATIAKDAASNVTVTVTFDGSTILSDVITVASGTMSESISVQTASNADCYTAIYSGTNLIADPTFSHPSLDAGGFGGWGPRAITRDEVNCGIGSGLVKGSCWPDGGSMDRSLNAANGNALVANTSYRLRAMIKNENQSSGFQFQVEGFDGTASKFFPIPETSGWEQFDASFKTGATVTEKGIYFNSCTDGNGIPITSTSDEICYIDNYELIAIPDTEAGAYAVTIEDGSVKVDFNEVDDTYTVKFSPGMTSVTPSLITIDPDATVTGNDPVDVSGGSGTSTLVVTARDNSTTKTYTINYERDFRYETNGNSHTILAGVEQFIEDISLWSPGDEIIITQSETILGTVDIFQEVTIMGDPSMDMMPELRFYDNGFRAKEDSINITIKGLKLNGLKEDGTSKAPYALRFDQGGWYNYKTITVEDCEIYNFNGGVQLWKNQRKWYDKVVINNVYAHDLMGDYVIDPRLNVVKELEITNSTFYKIKGLIKNVYNDNDGQNEWGVQGQNVLIANNTLDSAITDVLLQFNDGTDGSVTVEFRDNIVSALHDKVNARPFRINEAVGTVTLTNNIIHDFETGRLGGYNLDTLSLQSNVTVADIINRDPQFVDVANGDFTTPYQLGDPEWISDNPMELTGLEAFIENTDLWNPGDIIYVTKDEIITGTVDFFQGDVTIMADPSLDFMPELRFYDNGFRAKEDSINITIKGLKLNGLKEDGTSKAPYALRFDQGGWYNYKTITIEDCEIYNFNGGVQLWKNQRKWYDKVVINNVYAHDLMGDYVIDPRLNVVKELEITNSTFYKIKGLIKNVYNDNDGQNEWGVQGQNVLIANNTLDSAITDVLLQFNDGTDGSVTVEFRDNIVSALYDKVNARPFRINEAVGTVTLTNNIIHDFETGRLGGYNLDTLSLQSNVTVDGNISKDPQFVDVANGDFTTPYQLGDPEWMSDNPVELAGLEAFIENTDLWNPGDIIYVTKDEIITGTVDFFQGDVTIMADPSLDFMPELRFYDNGFRAKEDSINITIKGLKLNGLKEDGTSKAPYALRFDQGGWYNYKTITIEDCEIYNFNGGVQLWKNQRKWYDKVVINNVYAHDLMGDYVIDPRLNVVKELEITNSTFYKIKGLIKNVYNDNDGQNEWGVQGQNVLIANNTLDSAITDVLLQFNDGTDGSVTVDFRDNIVSALYDKVNARPFRINEAVGTVTLTNNIIHDFETGRLGGYNLDTLSLQSNVTVDGNISKDPQFVDVANGDFTTPYQLGDPEWMSDNSVELVGLEAFIENTDLWNPGDVIYVTKDEIITGTVDFFQEVTLMGDPSLEVAPELTFWDNGFRAKEDTISITLKNLRLNGLKEDGTSLAPYVLRFDQAGYQNYNNIVLEDIEAYNFNGGVQLYKNKNTMYESVMLNNVYFHDMPNDFALDPRLNAVKDLKITNSTFANVYGILKNPYFNKDGTAPLGAVGQNILVENNTFYKVGGNGGALIQINDPNDGSVTFEFNNNIASMLIDTDNARPFLVNEQAGTFSFENSVVHEFTSPRDNGIWNLDSALELSNVTSFAISKNNPGLADPDNGDFSTALEIGDPEWADTDIIITEGLEAFLEDITLWSPGDTIYVANDEIITGTIDIFQEVTIMGLPGVPTPELRFYDNGFRAKEDSINITIAGLKLNGMREDSSAANHALRFDQGGWYNYKTITIRNCEIYNFKGGIQLWKNQRKWYDKVVIDNVYGHDLLGDFFIDPRLNVVKELEIKNSTFTRIKGLVKNVYNDNDGQNEWGVQGQSVMIHHNTIHDAISDVLLQLNDGSDGSVTVDFRDNIVSGLYDKVNARPFRINEAVGTVSVSNNVIHDFETGRLGGYNLDTLSLQSNVTLSNNLDVDPMFKDPANGSYLLPPGSALNTAGTDGGAIGDPDWSGSMKAVTGGLEEFLETRDDAGMPLYWNPGDTIIVTHDEIIRGTVDLYAEVTIMGDPKMDHRPKLRFYDNGFRAKEDSINITIKGLSLNGLKEDNQGKANHALRFDQGGWYNYKAITIEDCEIFNFNGGVQLWKNQRKYYEKVVLNNIYAHDLMGDFVIDPRLNVVEELMIINSTFNNIKGLVKNVYNDNEGTNEFGAVAQHVIIDNNTMYNVVNDVLLQFNDGTDGSVTVDFTDNIVSMILDDQNARPFRINEQVGNVNISNSIFHNFESSRENGKYNLDSAAAQSNVTVSDVSDVDPGFADAANGDYTLSKVSGGLIPDTSGKGYIGDPEWVPIVPGLEGEGVHPVPNTPDSLEHFIENYTDLWNPGDTILLVSPGQYFINGTIDVFQSMTILGDPTLPVEPTLVFVDNGFRPKQDSISLYFRDFKATGLNPEDSSRANAFLRFDNFDPAREQTNYEDVVLQNVDVHYFKQAIQLYKGEYGHYNSLTVTDCVFENLRGDNAIDPRKSSVKQITIQNNTFTDIEHGFLGEMYWQNTEEDKQKDYYDQNVLIDHNTFFKVVGGGTKSMIQNNNGSDGSVNLVFSNNIVSTLWWEDWARPFRINADAGSFEFQNSIFHDFMATDVNNASYPTFNLDSVAKQDNVTLTNVDTDADYPMFADTTNLPFNFTLPLNSSLLGYGTDGGPIGDPRWFPEVGIEIVELTEIVVERDEIQMQVEATFGEGADQTATWSVINGTGEATITTDGMFTAVAAGDVKVVAVSNFSAVYTDTLDVSIEPYIFVESIALASRNANGTETTMITSKGGSLIINATIQPFSAPDKSLTWTLSDDSMAKLDSLNATSVQITAQASGTVTVTATANDGSGIAGTIDITMENQRPVTAITVAGTDGATEVTKGETLQMVATVEPADADVKEVSWKVDKASIATISAEGLLTAVSPGAVVVTASATDNSFKSGTATITVTEILSANGPELFTVYPNPASDFVRIKGVSDANVEIITTSGQVLISKQVNGSAQISLKGLNSGMYLMRVTTSEEVKVIRFSKN